MIEIFVFVLMILIILSLFFDCIRKKRKLLFVIFFVIINMNLFNNKSIINSYKIYLYGVSDFEKYAPYAQASMNETGVYASLTLAQAAQEQNFKSPVCSNGVNTNNLFGIKAGSNYTGKSCSLVTKEEYQTGTMTTISANFRVYDSITEGISAHGYFLTDSFGNRAVFNAATTLKDQLIALKSNEKAQYATDKDYLCKLVGIINRYDLTKYDEGITYSGRGISIVGKHEPNLTIDNCDSVVGSSSSDNSSSSDDIISYITYTTSYTGDIKKGYLYLRLSFKDYTNETDADRLDENMTQQIKEIFIRAVNSESGSASEGGNGAGLSAADSTGFKQRVSAPTKSGEGSKFYFTNDNASFKGGYTGQCTWYAFGRANEILANAGSSLRWTIASNAGLWYDQNLAKGASGFKSSNDYRKPKVGAIISWKKAGAPGHVAVVEAVNSDGTITISEANVSSVKSASNPYGWQSIKLSLGEVNRRWSTYTFSGYIYMLD